MGRTSRRIAARPIGATAAINGVALFSPRAYIRAVTSALYTTEILRLAASIPHATRLVAPMASAERRSVVCGSRVAADVDLAPDGRIAALGLTVRACALGQASASLMAAHAIGRSVGELADARAALAAWLAGERADAPDWPGLTALAAARAHPARHASILLPFDVVSEAARLALDAQSAAA